MTGENMLTLRDVNKTYNPGTRHAVEAVKDLSMTVNRGEIVALLGSSGCGKTSTLRMIAGFEEVTAGSITLANREIHQLMPAQRNVAMAFEGYSLYPPLTVAENIVFALKSSRTPAAEIKQRLDEITHLLDIEDILERYPSSISGGQQQRASLGRALIRQADLHLLDEPMGQLEPQLRTLLRGRIKHFIKERGLTVILVTHDQTEANALADRIAVMEEGELQQYASPTRLKDRPANLFTGTFIGEPPMNVFNAKIDIKDNRVRLQLADTVILDYSIEAFSQDVRKLLQAQQQITLGVRPHAISLVNNSSGPAAKVLANQWLGDQTHIAAEFADSALVAVKHDHISVKKGDTIHIALAPVDLHFFDPASGLAIAHGDNPA